MFFTEITPPSNDSAFSTLRSNAPLLYLGFLRCVAVDGCSAELQTRKVYATVQKCANNSRGLSFPYAALFRRTARDTHAFIVLASVSIADSHTERNLPAQCGNPCGSKRFACRKRAPPCAASRSGENLKHTETAREKDERERPMLRTEGPCGRKGTWRGYIMNVTPMAPIARVTSRREFPAFVVLSRPCTLSAAIPGVLPACRRRTVSRSSWRRRSSSREWEQKGKENGLCSLFCRKNAC